MNIAKILKNCPKGTKLYSSLYGEVELVKVKENDIYPIVVSCLEFENQIEKFNKDGKKLIAHKEPTLFPSRDQRDWSKFGANDQATDQKQKTEFKPFEKVLVRNCDIEKWKCNMFSHIDGYYVCFSSYWHQCIPYEGNEHLIGTTNKPE